MNLKTLLYAPILALATFISSCSIEIDPLSFSVKETVDERPPTSIGPSRMNTSGPWAVAYMSLDRSILPIIKQSESNVTISLTDCGEDDLISEDIYIDRYSLQDISSMNTSEFEKLYDSLNNPISARFYIMNSIYNSNERICGKIEGGSMIGTKIKSNIFNIK